MTLFITTNVEQAFERQAIFGLELIDAVTLDRVYKGIRVTARGLPKDPKLNSSGVYFWLGERKNQIIESISIDPVDRPFEPLIIPPIVLDGTARPILHRVELAPRPDYPIPSGTMGLMDRLVEDANAAQVIPVVNAQITLQFFEAIQPTGSVKWHDSRVVTHTNSNGDFVSIWRAKKEDEMKDVMPEPNVSLRIQVQRDGLTRSSQPWEQPFGEFRFPKPDAKQKFAWNSMT
jgi:hypothetical protein